ncbi:hypothetical protein J8273_6581 [Carpediemonas membranifera]|uniref:Uncharacterized protein n=1 Tax=Carpediemonas membranifera TaxID=201153 RepID=A0A8J6B2V8_9EUKA|nr:hypothetical protein J8273_6581 [Carpediemonas membranifera]|eukprot:KAG9391802.1 hypothetical protein J8273_6581 [Carpediemonas membranifera]
MREGSPRRGAPIRAIPVGGHFRPKCPNCRICQWLHQGSLGDSLSPAPAPSPAPAARARPAL